MDTHPFLTPSILCFFQHWYETLGCVCVCLCAWECACVIGPDFLLQFPAVRLAAEISWLNVGVQASVGNRSVATIPTAPHADVYTARPRWNEAEAETFSESAQWITAKKGLRFIWNLLNLLEMHETWEPSVLICTGQWDQCTVQRDQWSQAMQKAP